MFENNSTSIKDRYQRYWEIGDCMLIHRAELNAK